MRKNILAFVVVAMVLALSSLVYAEDGQTSAKVIHTELLNKFRQNTSDLSEQLKVKDLELRRLNGDETIDVRRADELEADIRGIKEKLRSEAASMNLEVCNCLKM